MPETGNWFDRQAASYSAGNWALWFHLICCQCPGVVVALLLLAGCRTERGKENGRRLLWYSLAGVAAAILLRFIASLVNPGGPGGR